MDNVPVLHTNQAIELLWYLIVSSRRGYKGQFVLDIVHTVIEANSARISDFITVIQNEKTLFRGSFMGHFKDLIKYLLLRPLTL